MANENEIIDPRFCHGPYIVFSDGSTYERADDTTIALITQDGEDHLNDAMDFDAVHDDDVVYISMSELLAAYNQVHGTNL
jgi:hypothetical protein